MKELYIVTGGTGFIGNNIVRELLARGKEVRCFVRNAEKAKRVLEGLNADVMAGALEEGGGFENAFTGADSYVLIHCAGLVSLGVRSTDKLLDRDNITATKYATDTAKRCGARKIVYISSIHAVRPPKKGETMTEPDCFDFVNFKDGYSRTKAIATKYVLDAADIKTETVTLHPSGVCGPNDPGETHLTKLVLQYNAGKIPCGVKGGYDFVDVRDVALAAAEAANEGKKGCYFLTGNYVTVKELFAHLSKATGRKPKKLMMPMWVAKAGLPFLLFYAFLRRTEPLYTAYSLSTLSENADFSNEKAGRELNFKPRNIAETIDDTAEFLRSNGRI